MDFIDRIRILSERARENRHLIQTEEATKMSLIIPFFQTLGYDFFNPAEVIPEYTADVGTKKGEKVDYAIFQDDTQEPIMLIEAKPCNEELCDKHGSQLYRYFSVTQAKFAILTNGIIYQFYTDLEESNKMDSKPFLNFNILDLKDNLVNEIKKFHKDNFDVETIFNTASTLKYSNAIFLLFSQLLGEPSDNFVNYVLSEVYEGRRTQRVIDDFRPVITKTFKQFVTEKVNERLKSAMETNNETENDPQEETDKEEDHQESKIETTPEELEGFAMIKLSLKEIIEPERLQYKDNESYFAVQVDGKSRQWVCRLYFNGNQKYIIIPDESKKPIRHDINDIMDITNFKDELINATKRYSE